MSFLYLLHLLYLPKSVYISPYLFTSHYTILFVSDYISYISVCPSMSHNIWFYLTISLHVPLYLMIYGDKQRYGYI